jgi:hypothetical protein
MRDNKEIALKAVKSDASLYNFVSERLKIDEDILNATDFTLFPAPIFKFKQKIDKSSYLKMLKSLSRYKTFSSNLLINVTDDVLNDKSIVIKTIKLSKNSYQSIPIHLKKDDDVVETLIKNSAFNESDLTKYFADYDKNLAILIVKYHPIVYLKLKYISFEHLHLGNYKENVLNHFKNNNYEFLGVGVDTNGYDYLYINGLAV